MFGALLFQFGVGHFPAHRQWEKEQSKPHLALSDRQGEGISWVKAYLVLFDRRLHGRQMKVEV